VQPVHDRLDHLQYRERGDGVSNESAEYAATLQIGEQGPEQSAAGGDYTPPRSALSRVAT